MKFLLAQSLALALACVPAAASAQIDWNRLSPQQRSVLTPLQRDWSTTPPSQQDKWLEVANRYNAMPAEEQTRVQQRMSDWSRLSAQDRARARLNFQETRQLGREERQQQWDAYRALPPEQRRALAERSRLENAAGRRSRNAPGNAATSEKSSLVKAPPSPPAQAVGPTVVQRGAGATTNLVSKPTAPPLHQQAGLPKVAATPGFVDAATLLPQRGAQGAAVKAPESDERKNKKQPRQQ